MANNRLFRAGLADSDSVAGLTDFAFRVYSLLVLASDDAGRLDGRPSAVRAEVFPVGRHADCRTEQLEKALAEIREARLLVRYEFASKPYLQITKVQRYGNSQFSRHPWSDGSFAIQFIDRETRDGRRAFVSTSLIDMRPDDLVYTAKNGTPSGPHEDGVGLELKRSPTSTGTGTKTNTGTKRTPSAGQKMAERLLHEPG